MDHRFLVSKMTYYSIAGSAAKKTDHNRRVYRLTEFFATKHRLVVTKLRIGIKSKDFSKCNHQGFNLEKLRDRTYVQEYAVTISNKFNLYSELGDPEKLLDDYKRETLKAVEKYIGERPRPRE